MVCLAFSEIGTLKLYVSPPASLPEPQVRSPHANSSPSSEMMAAVNRLRRHHRHAARRVISFINHQIKTPLAAIKAYVELLLDGDADDEATRREYLEVIDSQADRLEHSIDSILDAPTARGKRAKEGSR